MGEQWGSAVPGNGLGADCSVISVLFTAFFTLWFFFFLLKLVWKRCFEDWLNLPAVCSQVCTGTSTGFGGSLQCSCVPDVRVLLGWDLWCMGGGVMNSPWVHSQLRGFPSLHLSTKSSRFADWISQAFWTQDGSLEMLEDGHNFALSQSLKNHKFLYIICISAVQQFLLPQSWDIYISYPFQKAQHEVQVGLRFVRGGVRGLFTCTPSPEQRPCRQSDFCGSHTMMGLWAVDSHLERLRYLGKSPPREKNWPRTK